jgi:hypothetical protein
VNPSAPTLSASASASYGPAAALPMMLEQLFALLANRRMPFAPAQTPHGCSA